jgi:hypothetical protein
LRDIKISGSYPAVVTIVRAGEILEAILLDVV